MKWVYLVWGIIIGQMLSIVTMIVCAISHSSN